MIIRAASSAIDQIIKPIITIYINQIWINLLELKWNMF